MYYINFVLRDENLFFVIIFWSFVMSKNCENSIREAAYYLWENAGSPAGQDEYFWSLALSQVSGSSCKKASCSASSSKAKSSSAVAKKPAVKKAPATTKKASAVSK